MIGYILIDGLGGYAAWVCWILGLDMHEIERTCMLLTDRT